MSIYKNLGEGVGRAKCALLVPRTDNALVARPANHLQALAGICSLPVWKLCLVPRI